MGLIFVKSMVLVLPSYCILIVSVSFAMVGRVLKGFIHIEKYKTPLFPKKPVPTKNTLIDSFFARYAILLLFDSCN